MKYKLWFLTTPYCGLSFCIEAKFEWKHYDQGDLDKSCEELAKKLGVIFSYAEEVEE